MKACLDEYRRKRDFSRTPEPAEARRQPGPEPIYVIQKHAASTLHYDFRLEVDGVLKSGAVPKGPSLNPRERRLAVPTEDHPLDYADFEGVIPEGEYGGGIVMIWDIGTYRNLSDKDGQAIPMSRALEEGRAKFWLEGKRLRGGFSLIRTGRGPKANWLLIKMADEMADASRDPAAEEARSAVTGRTMEEIAAQGANAGG